MTEEKLNLYERLVVDNDIVGLQSAELDELVREIRVLQEREEAKDKSIKILANLIHKLRAELEERKG